MLKVKNIKRESVSYKEKQYPIIEVNVSVDNDEESREYLGSESLAEAILDKEHNPVDREAAEIECSIYAYFPDYLIKYSDKEIIRWIELIID